MRSAINFRDFGGMASRHGGKVAVDRLYRCGHMAAVAPEDVETLFGLDFALIADLRYARERETDRSPWPAPYASRIVAHNDDRSNIAPHVVLLDWVRAGDFSLRARMIDFYGELPFHPLYRPLFGSVLTRLAETDGRLLVHCTAGKDRTGTLCGLILHALGVPRDAILADYMRSRDAPGLSELAGATAAGMVADLGEERARAIANEMIDVEEAYLLAAFGTIEQQCGSIDSYLGSLGIDGVRIAALRSRLLV